VRADVSVQINAPIDRVFHWIDEPECVMQWLKHMAEYTRSDAAAPTKGLPIHQVWDDDGKRTDISGHITMYEPHTRLGVCLTGTGFGIDVGYELKENDGGTLLTQRTTIEYKGILRMVNLVASKYLSKSYTEELKFNFARLTELCEAEVATVE